MLTWPYQSPRRGATTQERPFGEFDACIGDWDIDGEPLTRAEGTRFDWLRARLLGGRTNHWGLVPIAKCGCWNPFAATAAVAFRLPPTTPPLTGTFVW